MQRPLLIMAGSLAAALLAPAAGARAEVVETRELAESVPVQANEPLLVIVKNITGSVHVTEHDRDTVEMQATETIRGDLESDIEEARSELQLRTQTEAGRVAFRVRRTSDAGDDCDCHDWGNGRWGGDYAVEYDIEVRVPRGAKLELATVNDGDVTAEGVTGDFRVSNVNGAVRLTGLTGSGEVTTVNGDVDATFARAPVESSSFRTVNGDIDVTLPNELSADLEFKTMNGDVLTDFELESRATAPTVERAQGNRFMLRSSRNSAFRVGSGGPALSFNTLNGDILLRKATR